MFDEVFTTLDREETPSKLSYLTQFKVSVLCFADGTRAHFVYLWATI